MSTVTATLLDFILPQDLAPWMFWIIHFEVTATVCVVWRVQVVARAAVRAMSVTGTMFKTLFFRLDAIFGAFLALARWQQVTVVNTLRLRCGTFTTATRSQIAPNLATN